MAVRIRAAAARETSKYETRDGGGWSRGAAATLSLGLLARVAARRITNVTIASAE